jgi:Flp pilus assembly protein TadG
MRKAIQSWAKLCRDDSGIALTEFAFVLPVLITMYLGGYTLSDQFAVNRKVTVAARSIADLASQEATQTAANLDSILDVSAMILSPYPATNAMTRVSYVTTDANGNGTVGWSRARNGVKRSAGTAIALPTEMRFPNMSLVYGEVEYTYSSPIANSIIGGNTLVERIYMISRSSGTITCTTC